MKSFKARGTDHLDVLAKALTGRRAPKQISIAEAVALVSGSGRISSDGSFEGRDVSAELEYLQVTEPPYPGPIKKIIETTPAHMRAFGYELAAAPCITLSTEWTPVELDLTNPLVDWRKKTIPIKAERYRLRFQRQRSRPASVGDVTKFKRAVKHRVQKWVKHPTPTRSPTVEKEYREQFGLTQTQSRDAMRELREAGIIPKAWSTRGRNPGLAKMLDRGGDYL